MIEDRDALAAARDAVYAAPLDRLDPADFEPFRTNTWSPVFERLRAEAPVHYCADSLFGPYWSVTRYDDILAVDTDHETFSSRADLGGISVADQEADFELPMFIAMDPPAHDVQRKGVAPALGPARLGALEPLIRERTAAVLDRLPRGEPFDWVEAVSIELTSPDAGDSVRRPGRGPDQADLVVQRRCRARPGRDARGPPGRAAGLPRLLRAPPGRADGRGRARPRLAAGPGAGRGGHAHDLPRQPVAADRGGQRHDAALHDRLGLRPKHVPGGGGQAPRRARPDAGVRLGGDPLADAARPHAPHRDP